jgi:hypothetical protein
MRSQNIGNLVLIIALSYFIESKVGGGGVLAQWSTVSKPSASPSYKPSPSYSSPAYNPASYNSPSTSKPSLGWNVNPPGEIDLIFKNFFV